MPPVPTESSPVPATAPRSPGSDSVSSASGRLDSLDLLRGLIMSLMAIDHASFFIRKQHFAEFWSGHLPSYSSAAGFLTRFITHLAAPGFFFLMGASMILLADSRRRLGWNDTQLR